MKNIIIILMLAAVLLPVSVWAKRGSDDRMHRTYDGNSKSYYKSSNSSVIILKEDNEPVPLADDKYFKYSFDKKPGIGTSILKVDVYDRKHRRSDDFVVSVLASHPKVKGVRNYEEIQMRVHRKGEFLLPINFDRSGDWELTLRFFKDGRHTNTAKLQLKL
ncbi:MAG: hypothetical protein R6V77_04715 [Candidatus Cloacimonadaceae bacterium]